MNLNNQGVVSFAQGIPALSERVIHSIEKCDKRLKNRAKIRRFKVK